MKRPAFPNHVFPCGACLAARCHECKGGTQTIACPCAARSHREDAWLYDRRIDYLNSLHSSERAS